MKIVGSVISTKNHLLVAPIFHRGKAKRINSFEVKHPVGHPPLIPINEYSLKYVVFLDGLPKAR